MSHPPYDPGRTSLYRPTSITLSGELVISMEIVGQMRLTLAVLALSHSQIWFAVTPLPDDRWSLSVLEESQDRLKAYISGVNAGTH